MGQKTDLHTHLNAVLPSEKMKELAEKLLGKEELPVDTRNKLEQALQKPLELISETNSWNTLQTINGNRKTIRDILIDYGYGNNFIRTIAEEYKKHGIKYVELTTDMKMLQAIREKKVDIKSIEEDYGITFRFLLGFNKNSLDTKSFTDKSVQKEFKDNPYLIGLDIMRN